MNRIPHFALTIAAALALWGNWGNCGTPKPSDVRPPAVSGQFYPADPQKLKLAIQQFLKDSPKIQIEKPITLIVPHAGYIYSGQICADAYRQVAEQTYDIIAILGVNHTTAGFKGISVGDYNAFSTPLGEVPVDTEITSALLENDSDCNRNREVHLGEHSIEVQLPFLQVLFPKARIVPAVIHPDDYKMCVHFGEMLAKVLKNKRALIIASSDLSHYTNYIDAKRVDRRTLETIAGLDTQKVAALMRVFDAPGLDTRACGEAAIISAMTAAKALGATHAVVAGCANSGDIPIGKRTGVVGYGALALTSGSVPDNTAIFNRPAPPSTASPLQESERKSLLVFARETIKRYLTTQTVPLPRNLSSRMSFPQGAFVTLRKDGQLRGCIGHMSRDMELGQTIGSMALQAAFNDPRFPPVQLNELKDLEIEISVLTPMKPLTSPESIVVGRDGVLISKAGKSAVFLPQVAVENNWNRIEMLGHLCIKGGLPSDCWKREAKFEVFQAEVFSESH
jgi:MEMO1 family protein